MVSSQSDSVVLQRPSRDFACRAVSHLERHAADDPRDQPRREPVIVASSVPNDRSHGGLVVVLDAATERVGKELLDHSRYELVRLVQQRPLETDRALEFRSVWKHAGGVNRFRRLTEYAHPSHGIEILG